MPTPGPSPKKSIPPKAWPTKRGWRQPETDYALVARNPITYGFLDRACQIMEMPEFLMNMVQRRL